MPKTQLRMNYTGFLQPRKIQIAEVFKEFSYTLLHSQMMCDRFLIQDSFVKPLRNSRLKYTKMIKFPLNTINIKVLTDTLLFFHLMI